MPGYLHGLVPSGRRARWARARAILTPALVQFIMNKYNMSADDCLTMLNKKSGVLALSDGVSSDFRDLEAAAPLGAPFLSPRLPWAGALPPNPPYWGVGGFPRCQHGDLAIT